MIGSNKHRKHNTIYNDGPSHKLFFSEKKIFYFMMMPGLLCLFIFSYIPMIGIIISFQDYNPIKGLFRSDWIGFKNFEFFFKSITVIDVTLNTLFYNLTFLITGMGISLLFAILLDEIINRSLAAVYKSVILLPYLFSWVVASYLLFSMLSPDKGVINNALSTIGKEPVMWYTEPSYWRVIIPIVYLWRNVGYSMVILIAGISGISKEYYEAAEIDGATKFQKTIGITIPMIMPIVVTLVLLQAGKIFYGNFGDWGIFFNMPRESGVLLSTTDVIDTYIYRSLRKMGDFGITSAVGLYQSSVGCLLVLASNHIIKKIDPDSAMF